MGVSRNLGGKMWTWEVRDSAKNFTKAQWMRTVAMVTDGSDWQFKGYPFETIVDMFTTIKGIYFHPAGLQMPLHVAKWAVSVLNLSPKQLQHRFQLVRDNFFQEVEKFMSSKRQPKFVNHTTLEGGRQLILKGVPVL